MNLMKKVKKLYGRQKRSKSDFGLYPENLPDFIKNNRIHNMKSQRSHSICVLNTNAINSDQNGHFAANNNNNDDEDSPSTLRKRFRKHSTATRKESPSFSSSSPRNSQELSSLSKSTGDLRKSPSLSRGSVSSALDRLKSQGDSPCRSSSSSLESTQECSQDYVGDIKVNSLEHNHRTSGTLNIFKKVKKFYKHRKRSKSDFGLHPENLPAIASLQIIHKKTQRSQSVCTPMMLNTTSSQNGQFAANNTDEDSPSTLRKRFRKHSTATRKESPSFSSSSPRNSQELGSLSKSTGDLRKSPSLSRGSVSSALDRLKSQGDSSCRNSSSSLESIQERSRDYGRSQTEINVITTNRSQHSSNKNIFKKVKKLYNQRKRSKSDFGLHPENLPTTLQTIHKKTRRSQSVCSPVELGTNRQIGQSSSQNDSPSSLRKWLKKHKNAGNNVSQGEQKKALSKSTGDLRPHPNSSRGSNPNSSASSLEALRGRRHSIVSQLDEYINFVQKSPESGNIANVANRLCCAQLLKAVYQRREQQILYNLHSHKRNNKPCSDSRRNHTQSSSTFLSCSESKSSSVTTGSLQSFIKSEISSVKSESIRSCSESQSSVFAGDIEESCQVADGSTINDNLMLSSESQTGKGGAYHDTLESTEETIISAKDSGNFDSAIICSGDSVSGSKNKHRMSIPLYPQEFDIY